MRTKINQKKDKTSLNFSFKQYFVTYLPNQAFIPEDKVDLYGFGKNTENINVSFNYKKTDIFFLFRANAIA